MSKPCKRCGCSHVAWVQSKRTGRYYLAATEGRWTGGQYGRTAEIAVPHKPHKCEPCGRCSFRNEGVMIGGQVEDVRPA